MFRVQKSALQTIHGQPEKSGKKSAKLATALTAVVVAGVLSGCATQKDDVTTSAIANDYRARHPIVVSESEVMEDLTVSAAQRKLSQRDINLVKDFARRFRSTGAKSVRIIRPVGSRNEHAARHVSRGIAHHLATNGISGNMVKHHTYDGSGHGDAATVRMSFDALTAGVESQCGQWNENLDENERNENYHNFGCATQNNLATVVANPADLLAPRGQAPIDATRRDNVISEWREVGSTVGTDE